MNILTIYLIGIIIITIIIAFIYINDNYNHQEELNKIAMLEKIQSEKNNKLEKIRAQTITCPVENLNDPRSCYFKSNYKCTWNQQAERCDSK